MVVKSQKQTEKFDIKEIYTPLSVAKKEIWRRWNDPVLKKKVEDFLGGDIPVFLKKKPKAMLVRYIASPNLELNYFLDIVNSAGMDFNLVDYSDDKFVAKNKLKYHLCNLFFFNGRGKKLGAKVDTHKIVNFNKFEGKKLNKIKTVHGQKLLDFHREILFETYPDIKNGKVVDFSKWFKKHKKKDEDYYLHYLSLFLTHGILFENFMLNKDEEKFTQKKVLPSFQKVTEIFGIKPLIVPLQPFSSEDDRYWYYYPNHLKARVVKKNKKRSG